MRPPTGNILSPRNDAPVSLVTTQQQAYLCHADLLPSNSKSDNAQDIHLPDTIRDSQSGRTYLPRSFLGKGGFAWCYELVDSKTGEVFAGKVIPHFSLTKPHHRQKVAREILIHGQLNSKHIVRCYASFEDQWNIYIILEYCSLKSLVHVLKRRSFITEPEARYYLRQLLHALCYLHDEKRVLHRDLKLGNLLLADNMQVKLADFGLACFEDKENPIFVVCGTPNYISPEVLNKKGHSYASESWAIGCILYAMLMGKPPFETRSLDETYHMIRTVQYSIPEYVSLPARDLIQRCLAPEASTRPRARDILNHPFLANGFTPAHLSPDCCSRQPECVDTKETVATSVAQRGRSSSNAQGPRRAAPTARCERFSTGSDGMIDSHSAHISSKSSSPARSQTASSGSTGGGCLCAPTQTLQLLVPEWAAQGLSSNVFRSLHAMYHNLNAVLSTRHEDHNVSMYRWDAAVLYVSKWIDYTNRYGFGCELSDGSLCVMFNDQARLTWSADRRLYQYLTGPNSGSDEQLICFDDDSIPACDELRGRVTIVNRFGGYMQQHLLDAGEAATRHAWPPVVEQTLAPGAFPYLAMWMRTEDCVLMMLSDGTLQANFVKEHTKFVISKRPAVAGDDAFLMTYIDADRQVSSYFLTSLAGVGQWKPDVLHAAERVWLLIWNEFLSAGHSD